MLPCSIQAAKNGLGLFHSNILRLCPAGPWFQLSCVFPAIHFPPKLSFPSLCSEPQAPSLWGLWQELALQWHMAIWTLSLLAGQRFGHKRVGPKEVRMISCSVLPAGLGRCPCLPAQVSGCCSEPRSDHAGVLLGRTSLPNPAPAD